eukprot:scpid94097/ scgid12571/ 
MVSAASFKEIKSVLALYRLWADHPLDGKNGMAMFLLVIACVTALNTPVNDSHCLANMRSLIKHYGNMHVLSVRQEGLHLSHFLISDHWNQITDMLAANDPKLSVCK